MAVAPRSMRAGVGPRAPSPPWRWVAPRSMRAGVGPRAPSPPWRWVAPRSAQGLGLQLHLLHGVGWLPDPPRGWTSSSISSMALGGSQIRPGVGPRAPSAPWRWRLHPRNPPGEDLRPSVRLRSANDASSRSGRRCSPRCTCASDATTHACCWPWHKQLCLRICFGFLDRLGGNCST